MSAKPTRTSMLNHSSEKPSALSKVPTLIGWNQAAGNVRPRNLPWPDREDTGTSRPEKFTAGMTERTELAKTADTCVWVKVETSCPKPVVENKYSSVPSARAPKEPLTGTWNTNNDINSRRAKVNMPTATYGACLPTRNSNLVMGVERKLAIDPVSFSSTTAVPDMMTGTRISIITMTLGTIAKTLLKAWL